MNISISISDIQNKNRLDSEYFQLKHLALREKLKKNKCIKLHKLCEFIQTGPAGSSLPASQYINSGIKVFRPSNLNNWTCNNGEFVYVSADLSPKLYHPGDILITRIGDIKFGIIESNTDLQSTISPNLIALRAKKDLLDPYFLLAFLNTHFGIGQINSGTKKVSLSSVEIEFIANLLVPLLSLEKQRIIGNLIKNALEKQYKAKKVYALAEYKLLQIVSFKKLKKTQTVYQTNFSIINKHKRADAQYFNTQKNNHKPVNTLQLGEICDIQRGIDPGRKEYQKDGFPFLRTGNITKFGIIEKSQKYLSPELFSKLSKKYQPRLGEILLVKDGKPGVALVIYKPVNAIVSEGIIRLRIIAGLSSQYLSLCINSLFCQSQILASLDGTLVPHWKVEQIKKLRIPIVDPVVQNEITNHMKNINLLFQQAEENLKKAEKLLVPI